MYYFILIVKVDHVDIDETFQVSMWANGIDEVLEKVEKIYKEYTDIEAPILLEKIVAIKESND